MTDCGTAGADPDTDPDVDPAVDAESRELAVVMARLEARFSPPLPPAEVHRCVADAIESLRAARIRRFVALLVERSALERLRALAVGAAAVDDDAPAERPAPTTGPRPGAAVSRPWWRRGRITRPSQNDRTPVLLAVPATRQPLEG